MRAYPYGDDPQYEDLEAEFVQPELLGDDGQTEIEHLYDLLAGLLDWQPASRLGVEGGVDRLKAHPYWAGVDWELVDAKRMPSPLRKYTRDKAAKRLKATAGGAEIDLSNQAGVSITSNLNSAFAETQKIKMMRRIAEEAEDELREQGTSKAAVNSHLDSFGFTRRRRLSEEERQLVDKMYAMDVSKWEFVSEHAVAVEYVEMAANVVSAV